MSYIARNFKHGELEFTVYGVKDISRDRFETCDPNEPGVVGWQVSYGGRAFCPVIAKNEAELLDLLKCLVAMYHEGRRDKLYEIREVLQLT